MPITVVTQSMQSTSKIGIQFIEGDRDMVAISTQVLFLIHSR